MTSPVLPIETPRLHIGARGEGALECATIVLRESGEAIGEAGIVLASIDGEMTHELRLRLAETHAENGYSVEAMRAMLDAAFGSSGLLEVRATAPSGDTRLRATLEDAGFRFVRSIADGSGRDGESALYAIRAPATRAVALIKMCGMTSPYDAELAVMAGANAVGMIFADSARRVTLEDAREIVRSLPALTRRVAVFVDAEDDEVRRVCDALGAMPQFSGSESLEYCARFGGDGCIRMIRVGETTDAADLVRAAQSAPGVLPFFETHVAGSAGGTGRRFDWTLAAAAARTRAIGISGGLTPENVAECVRVARPYALDVRSGIESGGRKDFERMQAFVTAALGAASASPAYA